MRILTPSNSRKRAIVQARKPTEVCHLGILKRLTAGDTKLMYQLMQMYIEAAESVVQMLPLQYEEKNFAGMRSTLHKFLSSAKTFGVQKLYKPINTILDAYGEEQMAALYLDKLIPRIVYLIECSQQELINKMPAYNPVPTPRIRAN